MRKSILFSACLLLVSCQTVGDVVSDDEVTGVEETSEVQETPVAEEVAAMPEAPVAKTGLDPAQPPETSATIDDMDLMELGTEDIRHLFGEPDLVRPEDNAEIWLYSRPACSVHLIYYADSEVLVYEEDSVFVLGSEDEEALKVRHVETRAQEITTQESLPLADEAACLQSLVTEPLDIDIDG